MNEALRLPAFTACGIELEYMIVDGATLAVRPIADELLRTAADEYVNDVDRGAFGWSNELALHLVELKNADPRLPLPALAEGFQAEVREIEARLRGFGARLMPTAMHPFMNPAADLRLWPHEYSEVYRNYDRIFNCRRHGWANLQSMHVNLPFADDAEFARLHAAVRHVLPILPALAASSPIADGRVREFLDFRLECYRTHVDRVPAMMGEMIPESIASEAQYRDEILAPIYRAIAPLDPDEEMRDEWLNARGAIARFDRNAIEIRVIDTQECPRADVAVATAVTALVRACYDGGWSAVPTTAPLAPARLRTILMDCARAADGALITDRAYLESFHLTDASLTAGELWHHLLGHTVFADRMLPARLRAPLETILREGPLARRILRATGTGDLTRDGLVSTYTELCNCLAENRSFVPDAR